MSDLITSLKHDMIIFLKGDQKRVHHNLKVHSFTALLGHEEKTDDNQQLCLEIAGLLHDIGIHECERKYGSSAGNYQEIESPPIARKLLEPYELSEEILQRTLYIIGHHHSCKFIDGPDFQLLMEADFLVNMFEDNLNANQINGIEKNLFKSKTGIKLLTSLSKAL